MARITIEDCLEKISSRFKLVLVASARARQLARGGATPLVPVEGDKVTVIALREIALGLITESILDENQTPPKVVVEDICEIPNEIIAETQQTEAEIAPLQQENSSVETEE
ncbi:MAG TPA: DNA-directed RNA polymerase subunit omega [Coxiellaceae bacterium]|nr:DNA-directed RNA polymerase subunit omega [Coxiellaceae bacterium]HBS52114.1 DNA-directed RNA polymerase subunit omega [Coxiellaceae bacterium]